MRKIDKNGDGTFEKSEDEAAWKRYRQLDANHDGTLSIDELRKEQIASSEAGGERKLNVVYKQITGKTCCWISITPPATTKRRFSVPRHHLHPRRWLGGGQ